MEECGLKRYCSSRVAMDIRKTCQKIIKPQSRNTVDFQPYIIWHRCSLWAVQGCLLLQQMDPLEYISKGCLKACRHGFINLIHFLCVMGQTLFHSVSHRGENSVSSSQRGKIWHDFSYQHLQTL